MARAPASFPNRTQAWPSCLKEKSWHRKIKRNDCILEPVQDSQNRRIAVILGAVDSYLRVNNWRTNTFGWCYPNVEKRITKKSSIDIGDYFIIYLL